MVFICVYLGWIQERPYGRYLPCGRGVPGLSHDDGPRGKGVKEEAEAQPPVPGPQGPQGPQGQAPLGIETT